MEGRREYAEERELLVLISIRDFPKRAENAVPNLRLSVMRSLDGRIPRNERAADGGRILRVPT